MNIDDKDIELSICESPFSPNGGVEVGVEIRHIKSGVVVKSTDQISQYLNKQAALSRLKKLINTEV